MPQTESIFMTAVNEFTSLVGIRTIQILNVKVFRINSVILERSEQLIALLAVNKGGTAIFNSSLFWAGFLFWKKMSIHLK
ncbi:hypothetical protein CYJ36_09675 [Bacillus sp. UMB0893]|nr:hypothetical protein CYJ36_09675 [Bacillus sp. UMB0893]